VPVMTTWVIMRCAWERVSISFYIEVSIGRVAMMRWEMLKG
jgi:hypothetical protein